MQPKHTFLSPSREQGHEVITFYTYPILHIHIGPTAQQYVGDFLMSIIAGPHQWSAAILARKQEAKINIWYMCVSSLVFSTQRTLMFLLITSNSRVFYYKC